MHLVVGVASQPGSTSERPSGLVLEEGAGEGPSIHMSPNEDRPMKGSIVVEGSRSSDSPHGEGEASKAKSSNLAFR